MRIFILAATLVGSIAMVSSTDPTNEHVALPDPALDGDVAVEHTLAHRRSVRSFDDAALTLEQIGQLLWAAQGITRPVAEAPEGWQWGPWQGGFRTAPSAGALYPLELYLVAGRVDGLEPGVYRYVPREHALERTGGDDRRQALSSAALNQRSVADAPAVVVVSAVYARTAVKYGDRAERYVHIEVGAAAENLALQAVALELGTVFVGAFRDGDVQRVLGLSRDHEPLLLVPMGRPEG